WGDYDNDGDLDLFVANASEDTSKTRNFLYRNNGNGNFTKITTGAIVNDKDYSYSCQWGDLDGDGWLDLMVGNSTANAIYQNNGGTFTRLYAGMGDPIVGSILTDGGLSRAVSFVDFNLDGDEDIFVVNQGNTNPLYQHIATENNWLRVQARGSRANHFADGSLVKVKASINGQSFWQTREITSQTGGSASSGLTASFGLGNAVRADSVKVIFPNGAAQILTNVNLNQTLTLNEPKPPLAAFTMDRSFGAPPLTVQFTDSSRGVDAQVAAWHWDFGDGETSTQQNPAHTFDEEGSYTVKLTITDANGSPASATDTIEVSYFSDVTAGDLSTLASYSYSASWGDYDNDGDEDIFVANYSNRVNWLFRNDGGSFTWIESTPFTEQYGNSYSGHWGDADNDGDLDLLILNTSSYGLLYINQGNGTFLPDEGSEISDTYFNNPYDAAWGDMDGDGDLDLIVAQYNNYPILFENVDPENLEFEQNTESNLVQSYRSYTSVNFVDYDQDGDADCFFTTYGANYLYINVGDSTFVTPDASFYNDTQYSYGQTWGDYDNDGDLDLYLANYSNENALYRNDGDSFTKITSSEVLNGNSYSYSTSWVDLNNDGWLDLWVSNYGQNDDYFENNGDGTFTQNTTLDILSQNYYAYQSVFADYDGNGSLDLFTPFYQSSTHNILSRNNGNSNHWSTISLRGRESNRFGVNAKIRLLAPLDGGNGTWQMREVGADVGGYGENSLVAHFGLGSAETIDSLIVEWPNGLVQSYSQLTVDTKFHITESSGPPPNLSWTPPVLESVVVGQNQIWSTTVTLSNTGEGSLVYDISTSDSWLSADPASGEIPAGDSIQVTLEIDADELSQGEYEGQFTLYTNDLDDAVIHLPVGIQVATYAAFFDYSPTEGFAPLTVNFTDQSISVDYTISQWHWDFGDETQSTVQNPTHIYTTEGEYPVTLTITNSADQTAQFAGGPVQVIPTIEVDFTADETSGGNPHTVTFMDMSLFHADTSNQSWTWNFGDGVQSGLQNPSHTYTTEGVFTVSLTVSDGTNSYTTTKNDYITVINYPNFELSVSERDTLDMEIVENDVSTDTIMVYNPGGLADLEFGTSESISWLSVSPATGTVPPNDSLEVVLTYSSNNLGTFAGTLRFFANDENSTALDLMVTMHVVEYPYLPQPFRAVYATDGSALNLTWTDRSRIEDGYHLYKQNGVGNWELLWTAPANAVEFTDSAVDTNQTWRYQIRSFLNSRGESADAIQITVPAKPQLASVTRNGDVVTLTPASTATGTNGLFAERWVNDEPPVIGARSTTVGSVRDTINFGFADSYQYRVYAYGGEPTGSYGQSWPSAKIALPEALHGDYTGDDVVDVQDAIPFVNAWLTDNYTKETGPVTGSAPDFTFSPDGVFDSYDMAAFVGMYRYSAANLSASTLARRALNHPGNLPMRYEPDEEGITIRLLPSASVSPKAMTIWLHYNQSSLTLGDYQVTGLAGAAMSLEAADTNPVNLAWIDMTNDGLNASGTLEITIRLNHMDGGEYTSDVTVTGALLDASSEYIALNRTNTSVVYTPDEFVVEPVYPNPFNPTLHLKYGLPEAGNVNLQIFDIRGHQVAQLLNQQQSAGWYTVAWNGKDDAGRTVATGVYFIRAQAAGLTHLQKVVFLK
ncbi:MAG: FG-GAP-like repeat-containing protein, partial [Candidatus Marinimicrobia bacterium]|nr:FG-GAP-like repeat-containing protein [Candidatus Neomarinimicrobiota bacterium]